MSLNIKQLQYILVCNIGAVASVDIPQVQKQLAFLTNSDGCRVQEYHVAPQIVKLARQIVG